MKRGIVENTLKELGYRIERFAPHPVQAPVPAEQAEWYCILAKKS